MSNGVPTHLLAQAVLTLVNSLMWRLEKKGMLTSRERATFFDGTADGLEGQPNSDALVALLRTLARKAEGGEL